MLIESQATNGTKGKSILTNPTHLWCLSDISSSYVPTMQWYRQGHKWRSIPQQQWQLRPPNWLNKQTVQELHNLRSKCFRAELFIFWPRLTKQKFDEARVEGWERELLAANSSILKNPFSHERSSWLVWHGHLDWQMYQICLSDIKNTAWLAHCRGGRFVLLC